MIPAEMLMKIKNRKDNKYRQRNYFLGDFELGDRKKIAADAVGGYEKAIFHKRNAPADEYNGPECGIFIFQMPIPGNSHKQVRQN